MRSMIRSRYIVIALMSFFLLSGGLGLPLSIGADDIGSLAESYGLDRSDGRELNRVYRGAVKAGVDAVRLERLIERSLQGGIDFDHLIRAVTLVTNTAINGLPVNPVLNKFSEGLAKGVDSETLVEVIGKRALSLTQARNLVSVLIYEDTPVGALDILLVSVADALERGVSERKIEKAFKEGGANFRGIVQEIEELR